MIAVYGYKIYTESVENDNGIGLYSGEIRWLEAPIAGLSQPWKTILVSSPAETDDGLDTKLGGGVAEVGGFSIIVDDTLQVAARLEALGIVLTGKRCEKIRIDPASLKEFIEFTGYCEEIKWNEREMKIPVQDCRLKRDATTATVITATNRPNASSEIVGGCIPVTYGHIDKAKMVRTANAQALHTNPVYGTYLTVDTVNKIAYTLASAQTYPFGLTVFPVIGKGVSPTRHYTIQLAGSDTTIYWTKNSAPISTGYLWLSDLMGRYLYIVSGDGSGQYRRIESAYVDFDGTLYEGLKIHITVNDFFKEEPIGNATGTATQNATGNSGQNSWVQIIDIARVYEADVAELQAFTDETGAAIVTPNSLKLFSYDQPKSVKVETLDTAVTVQSKAFGFYQLPGYAYTESITALKNSVTIDAKLFESNPDQMNSFTILPITALEAVKDDDLGYFDVAGGGNAWDEYHPITTASHLIGGYYYRKDGSGTPASLRGATTITGALADVIDKNRATYYEHNNHWNAAVNMNQHAIYCHAIRFHVPKLDGLFEWDDCFVMLDIDWMRALLGTDVYQANGDHDKKLYVRFRRFLGGSIDCFTDTEEMRNYPNEDAHVKNTPDFYYGAVVDNNKAFYWENDSHQHVYGYSKFIIPGINTDEAFNAIRDFTILTRKRFDNEIVGPSAAFDDKLRIYELAVMFRKSVSIQDAIYTGLNGRIRGTAWRAGRAATDLLDDPIDILEDLLRRGNWSETGDTNEPGITQAAHAKINVKTTHGGFEAASLDAPRQQTAARQIFDVDESRLSELIPSLCREFHLIQYRESNGSENVVYFPERDSETPVRTITLSDVPEGVEIPDVEPPSPSDIFCYDLNIRYKQNYASNGWDGLLRITNTDADTYDPDYVVGYNGGYKQAIWERAHTLYAKYKRQEKPPAELVDLKWHRTADSAAWYLRGMLNWMDHSRLTLPVLDSVARKVPKFSRVTINLPHQTDGQDVVCFVERIKRNPRTGISELSLVLYDDISWTGSGVSYSDSSASDSKSSSSDSVSISISISGSKSRSSSSDSVSVSASVSVSSSSDSSEVLINDDHRHTKIMCPDNQDAGLEIIDTEEIQIGAALHQLPAASQQGTSARILLLNNSSQCVAIGNGPQVRWMIDAQAHDLDLTAISALATTGIACRTAGDTWALRELASGNVGIAVTNEGGVAGNPTITLDSTLINAGIADSLHHHAVLYESDNGAAALSADAVGNLGFGVTANAWHADDRAVDFGGYGSFESYRSTSTTPATLRMATNIYRDVAGNWLMKTSGQAVMYEQINDLHRFYCDTTSRLAGQISTPVKIVEISAIGTGFGMTPADVATVETKANYLHHNLNLVEYTGSEAWQIGVNGDGDLVFYNDTVAAVYFNDGGSYGFGITPTHFMHAKKNQDAATEMFVENTNNHAASTVDITAMSNGTNQIGIYQHSSLYAMTYAGLTDLGMSMLYSSNVNGLLIENASNTAMYLATNNVVRMTIAAAGTVGIGMTPATAALDIKANASNYNLCLVETGAGAEAWQLGVNADGDLIAYNDTVAALYLMDNGNFGFGVSPSYFMHARKDQNADTVLMLFNATNDTASKTSIYAEYDATHLIAISNYSPLMAMNVGGLTATGMSLLFSRNDNGLLINNYSNTPIYIATNNTVALTIDAARIATFAAGVFLPDSIYLKLGDTIADPRAYIFAETIVGPGDTLHINSDAMMLMEIGASLIMTVQSASVAFGGTADVDVFFYKDATTKAFTYDHGLFQFHAGDLCVSSWGGAIATPDGKIWSDGTDLLIRAPLEDIEIQAETVGKDIRLITHSSGATKIGDGGTTDYTKILANGDVSFYGAAGFYPRRISQNAAPASGTGAAQIDVGELIIWHDADGAALWLLYNDTTLGIMAVGFA